MKTILLIASYLGLALTILPCFFVVSGMMTSEVSKSLMIIGTLLWFGISVFLIFRKKVCL
jgi:hypothetical protein